MEPAELVALLSRWLHVLAAIVMLGGSIFMRFVLMPAADALPEAEHLALRERVMGTWRKIVGAGIGLLLLSGFYNYLVVTRLQHEGDSLYHALMGTKILLAFGVFFLASALSGRSKGLEGFRQKRKFWLGVTILLATLVVVIAGYLKVARPATSGPTAAASSAVD